MRILKAILIALLSFFSSSICLSQTGNMPVQNAFQPSVVKKVLDNGLTVIVKPEPGSGLVAISAMVKAGAAQESIQDAGIGNFVAQLLLASTRSRSADDVAEVADSVGGNIVAQWYPDFTTIKMVTTSQNFRRAMSLIGECLTDANFEDKWIEQTRADLKKSINIQSDDIFENAYSQMKELLYEDNGYRRPPLGNERTINIATKDDLEKFYSRYYVPNNIVISIVGDVTAEQAIDRADNSFAGASPAKLPYDRGVPDEKLEQSKFHVSEVDLGVACLMLGWLAPSISSSDYPAMEVATNALGGGKGSIMFRELRQKRGMGYDTGAIYQRYEHQGHIIAYVITDPYKVDIPGLTTPRLVLDGVKKALLDQIKLLKDQPLSEKDLQRAKGYTVGSYTLSHQRLMERAFELGSLESMGVGWKMYYDFADKVDAVTASDVQRAANKYFNNYAAVLLLPRSQSPSQDQSK